jgi:hypothetical protein
LTRPEERTVPERIGTKQATALCEVRDYASPLLSERYGEGSTLGKASWQSFRRWHAQDLRVNTATAREPARSALMCSDFACYFSDVVGAVSKCFAETNPKYG